MDADDEQTNDDYRRRSWQEAERRFANKMGEEDVQQPLTKMVVAVSSPDEELNGSRPTYFAMDARRG